MRILTLSGDYMKRFTDIEQLRHVIKRVRNTEIWKAKEKYKEEFDGSKVEYPVMTFSGTVKLHGCNSGLVRNATGIKFQSRERFITADNDNYGFASYMGEVVGEEALNELFDMISTSPNDEITIFGEWIGKGIQKKVAITQLEKQFVIFNIHVNGEYVPNFDYYELPNYNIYNILLAPTFKITIDFNDAEKVKDEITQYVNEIDLICSWAKMFDVEGHGEGIVWCAIDAPQNSDLWFKTKGTSHKISKQRDVVQIAPEVLESIKDFVDYSVTESRLEQALRVLVEEFGIPNELIDMKHFGKFIKWVSTDINKEEYDVLEENELEWKQVAKPIANRCKVWFMEYIDSF